MATPLTSYNASYQKILVGFSQMLFGAKQAGDAGLQPFVLRLRDGYLVGMGLESDKGSPCIRCAELWLTQRRVWTERIPVDALTIRRDVLDTVKKENSAHVFHEISSDGTVTRMDCLVFPHPECSCNKQNYLPPAQPSQRTNFAFSPVYQIKCARYGTPNGNLWLTHASGSTPGSSSPIRVYATGKEREISRMKAVDEWMKRAAYADLANRVRLGKPITGIDFRTGKWEPVLTQPGAEVLPDGLGAGATEEEAIQNGLLALAKARTLRKYAGMIKNPMLVVGTTNWVRTRVPFFLLQQYDLHLLFYPNSTPSWIVGVCALSRQSTEQAPIFTFASDGDILNALDTALGKMLEQCRPADWQSEEGVEPKKELTAEKKTNLGRLGVWWNNWIYRCPKISLKDVLHLEAYTGSIDLWKNYFLDGQEKLSFIPLNTPHIPERLRYLVKVQSPLSYSSSRNVNGIGTLSSLGGDTY